MGSVTLEERLAAVEEDLAQLKRRFVVDGRPGGVPWWEERFGAFADSPEYMEAGRLGREYRESLWPEDTDGAS